MNIYILFGKKIFFAEKYGTNVRKNESKGSMRSKKDCPAKQCGQSKVLSICRKYIGRTGQKNFAFSRKALDKMCGLWYNLSCCRKAIWVWRSLVARYLGVVEAVGSNPATQTKTPEREYVREFFAYSISGFNCSIDQFFYRYRHTSH